MAAPEYTPEIQVVKIGDGLMTVLTTPAFGVKERQTIDRLLAGTQRLGGLQYDLALMEGLDVQASGARYVLGKIHTTIGAIDPFADPMGPDVFALLREAYPTAPLDELATCYVCGWISAAQELGWGQRTIHRKLAGVLTAMANYGADSLVTDDSILEMSNDAVHNIWKTVYQITSAKSGKNIGESMRISPRTFVYCASQNWDGIFDGLQAWREANEKE